MMYVAVKHNPLDEKRYWFYVPGILMERVRVGRKVMCQTRYGKKEGVITAIISGIKNDTVRQITGNEEPFQPVVGVFGVIALTEISVPLSFKTSVPSGEKLVSRIRELLENGGFDTTISVNQLNELQDGYTAYLIAKAYGLDTVKVLFVI